MAQGQLAQIIGLRDNAGLNAIASSLNSADSRYFYSFVLPSTKTLSKVMVRVNGVTGTLGANDIVCELWSMPTGAIASTTSPDTLLESRNTVTTTPTGQGWVEVTGFTTSCTGGVQYALIFRNLNGTPASNLWSLTTITGNTDLVIGSGSNGWITKTSTDAGSTWGAQRLAAGGLRLEFSDGSFNGIPVQDGGAAAASYGIYSDKLNGAKFTTPANAKMRVRGLAARITTSGAPTGNLIGYIYQDTTLVGTTAAMPQRQSANYAVLWFASEVTLSANTSYRIVLGETTQSDTSAHRYNMYQYTVENSAPSKALLPFGGWVETYWDGSSWTDTDTLAPVMWMILDSDTLFDSVGRTVAFSSIG